MRAFRHQLDTPLGRYHHYIVEGHWRFMYRPKMMKIIQEIKKHCTESWQQRKIDEVMDEMKRKK